MSSIARRIGQLVLVGFAALMLALGASQGVARAGELPPLGPGPVPSADDCTGLVVDDGSIVFLQGEIFVVTVGGRASAYRADMNMTLHGVEKAWKCSTASGAQTLAQKLNKPASTRKPSSGTPRPSSRLPRR